MEIRFGNTAYNLDRSGFRKLLHDAVDEAAYDLELDDDMLEELEQVHALISSKNVDALLDGFFLNGHILFYPVEHDDFLKNALEEAGYKVTQSFASFSLYVINDDGEEVRISNHKRPAYERNDGLYDEHEYENEIIIKDNIVKIHDLKANGITKLTKDEYLLG